MTRPLLLLGPGHLVRRALLTPDEVRRLPADSQILFKAGAPPIFARKLRYYADPEFRRLFDVATYASAASGRRLQQLQGIIPSPAQMTSLGKSRL